MKKQTDKDKDAESSQKMGDTSSEPRKSDSPEKNGEKVKASEEEKDKSDKENDGKASDDKGEGQPADKEMKKDLAIRSFPKCHNKQYTRHSALARSPVRVRRIFQFRVQAQTGTV